MNLSGKNVIVLGLGASGAAAAELCLDHGARVTGTDSAPLARMSDRARALEGRGARLVVGGHDGVGWDAADLIVVSPGVPSLAVLDQAARAGVEVIGELELASRFVSAPVVAIGGTNGKSTVTSLVAAMLEADGKRVFAGGNLGTPLSEARRSQIDVAVVEVSSFQTERIPTFRPRVAALLNITDDHLDRYPGFEAYAAAKGNLFVNQTDADLAVVPHGDAIVAGQAARGRGRVVTFGPGGDVAPEGDCLVDRHRGWKLSLDAIRLKGGHNVLNACAAVACAAESGATRAAVSSALASFEGLAHRSALVAAIDGVRYYDDSKGTNVGAVVAALAGLAEARVVLIAGGRDKGGSYAPLIAALAAKQGALVVIGEAAERIAAAAAAAAASPGAGASMPIERAANMRDAVRRAAALARPGNAVLLSPACSSFDMFSDYKERGDVFASEVRALLGKDATSGRGSDTSTGSGADAGSGSGADAGTGSGAGAGRAAGGAS